MITLFLFGAGLWIEIETYDTRAACEAEGQRILENFNVEEYLCLRKN